MTCVVPPSPIRCQNLLLLAHKELLHTVTPYLLNSDTVAMTRDQSATPFNYFSAIWKADREAEVGIDVLFFSKVGDILLK